MKPSKCMQSCLAKMGAIGAAKTLSAESAARVVAARGGVSIAYGWAWFNSTFPYAIPAPGFLVYANCKKDCEPVCLGESDTTFFGAP